MTEPIDVRQYENLRVEIYEDKEALGRAAAAHVADRTGKVLQDVEKARLLFSTGASQFEFVAALKDQSVDWQRVLAFHLDEYRGISPDHPASFRLWLRTRVEEPLSPSAFYYLEGDAPDTEAECRRYEQLLTENPIDLGFIGVGENGHIAFNDPPVADFNDPKRVKVVTLDEACRRQQVGEGWFETIDDVPKEALTLTVPAIMACKEIVSVVPDRRKAAAVKAALTGPIDERCPGSILRTHQSATLFLDKESASEI